MDVHVKIETQPIDTAIWSEVLDAFLDELEGAGALGVVSHGHGMRAGALFDVVAPDLPSAGIEVTRLVSEVFEKVAAGTGARLELARMELVPSDAHELEYLGASDIARALGLTRQRVYQLAREDFPRPTMSRRGVRLWNSDDLRDWAAAHGRELIGA